ncbi:MFS transporter [Paenibacillus cymbidii]|uniref:MFS transporter n=1 Tax=Paenibacillus cymbidii TaxID=1639034 RepID=UPI0010801F9A|nr:MFS transporter [Paenibacillus cymbidii]
MTDRAKPRFPGQWLTTATTRGEEAEHDTARASAANRGAKAAMSGQAKLLLLVNGLFAVANALSGTFVNVYLWKVKSDYTMIASFAIAHQITMALTFWLAGKWVKEHNKMNCLRLGVAMAAVFYSLVLALGAGSAVYVLPLGAVLGLSSGFFWLAFNVVYFEVTSPDTRDRFNGMAGLFGSLGGMIAPWVSGFLISRMTGNTGYRIIFALSLAVFVIGAVASFFLHKRKESGHYEWFHGWRALRRSGGPWRIVSLSLVAQGVREGVFGFAIGLLVYIATGNEMKLGNFALISSGVALVSFWLVGKLLKPKYRRWGMLVGTVLMSAAIVPFFWQVSFATLLAFGIATAMFIPLYTIPITSVVFDLIGKDEESAAKRVEFIVLREVALNAGRLLGAAVFVLVVSLTSSPVALNWLLLGIGSSPVVSWMLIRRFLGERQRPSRFGRV